MAIRDESDIEKKTNLFRDHQIKTELDQMERAAKAAGRPFRREDHKVYEFDWLLMKDMFLTVPGSEIRPKNATGVKFMEEFKRHCRPST